MGFTGIFRNVGAQLKFVCEWRDRNALSQTLLVINGEEDIIRRYRRIGHLFCQLNVSAIDTELQTHCTNR